MDDLSKQMHGLICQTQVSDELHINVKAIRPCVARIKKHSFSKGDLYNRSLASSILASELLALNFPTERVLTELTRWNSNNEPPLKQSDLRSTIKTAQRILYNYSCNHHYLIEFCIGNDLCDFSKRSAARGKTNQRAFFAYGWQLILDNVSKLVYLAALPEIERRRGFKPGSRLYVSHKDIAKFAGISNKSVKKALEELAQHGLVEYKAGISRKWEGKASEVQRVFPIVKPSKETLKRRKKY